MDRSVSRRPVARWRQIQREDEGWQYEEEDETFIADTLGDGSQTDADGWRPLAAVWQWDGEDPCGWRAQLASGGVRTNRDYRSLKAAKKFTEKRLTSEEKRWQGRYGSKG